MTPEQIDDLTTHLDGLANIRAINKLFRDQDESNLWPISGKFNATSRAIDRVRQTQRHDCPTYGIEYAYALENEISNIVNNERNW